jgi:sterol desaturase/sphingolipid hydroxylase (fatty acid hydroxylase superfamily)
MIATFSADRWIALGALGGVFAFFLALEWISPLRRRTAGATRRILTNAVISALGLLAGGLVVRPAALRAMGWASERDFGLLAWLALPPWADFCVGFLLLDLTFYYWHRLNHRSNLLWRFHSVHHVDPDMDVTTSFRFHFGEILYSAAFRALQMALLGVSPVTFVVFEFAFQASTMFHHSNLLLPLSLERGLNVLLVTPRMHGIHHSRIGEETNSNYSVIFPWWDQLHRTLRLNVPQAQVEIGVGGYEKPSDNALLALLALPFRRERKDKSGQRKREGLTTPKTRLVR